MFMCVGVLEYMSVLAAGCACVYVCGVLEYMSVLAAGCACVYVCGCVRV